MRFGSPAGSQISFFGLLGGLGTALYIGRTYCKHLAKPAGNHKPVLHLDHPCGGAGSQHAVANAMGRGIRLGLGNLTGMALDRVAGEHIGISNDKELWGQPRKGHTFFHQRPAAAEKTTLSQGISRISFVSGMGGSLGPGIPGGAKSGAPPEVISTVTACGVMFSV